MYVEIHMVQNFAPSCLNRDDTNTPKDCEFGGYRRARISSQCLKRAIRLQFKCGLFEEKDLSVRTKLIVEKVVGELKKLGKDESKAQVVVTNALSSVQIAAKDNNKTEFLLFLSESEIASLTKLCNDHWDELASTTHPTSPTEDSGTKAKKKSNKKDAKASIPDEVVKAVEEIFKNSKAADLALFGRMIATGKGGPDLNVDGAAQVAHAFSTHKVSMEMDFYTAVDDLQPSEESGAGMMGTVGFNSACFYRYSLVNVDLLLKNLNKDKALAAKTIEGFIKGSITAIPTGKQNSMAAHNLPSMIMVVVRSEGQPFSMANAYARPVFIKANADLVSESILCLDNYFNRVSKVYGESGIKHIGFVNVSDVKLEKGAKTEYESVDKLVKGVRGVVDAYLAAKN